MCYGLTAALNSDKNCGKAFDLAVPDFLVANAEGCGTTNPIEAPIVPKDPNCLLLCR